MRLRNTYRQRKDVAKPPPRNLMPLSTVLVDWDSLKCAALLSVMPEEGEQRAGLVEEYLWGYINILRQRNSAAVEIAAREKSSFLRDEEEERRFLAEDADRYALRTFITDTEKKCVEVLVDWEEQSRAELMKAHREYLGEAFNLLEELHRMHVSTQAFDSVFLKLCQVNPYWMWRKLKFIEVEQEEMERRRAQEEIVAEERVARREMINDYNRCFTLALEMKAFVEKADIYRTHEVFFTDTCAVIMEDSAIKIQAALRGFLSRKRHPIW